MSTYIKSFADEAEYLQAKKNGLTYPNVSYVEATNVSYFNPKITKGISKSEAVVGDAVIADLNNVGYKYYCHQADYNTNDWPTTDYKVIGVVVNNDTENEVVKAVSLAGMSLADPVNGTLVKQSINGVDLIIWGYDYYNLDISGLTNYATADEAKADFNGWANTQAIMEYVSDKTIDPIPSSKTNGVFQAAMVCQRFNPDGETAGQWYLPAAGEMYNYVGLNKDAVNTALQTYGGFDFINNNNNFWCSNEQTTSQAYFMRVYNNSITIDKAGKSLSMYVRAFIQL